jgi:hypothetical protein
MARAITLAGLMLGAALPACGAAYGQVADQAAASPWKVDARLTLAAAAMDDETRLAPAAHGLLADGDLTISRTDTLSNGLQLVWRGEVRIERDAPSRPSFAGVLGNCPPTATGCARLVDTMIFSAPITPVSPTTGLAAFGAPASDDIFATLEGASLSVIGPWGEGMAGFDAGVASRLDARPPTVMAAVSAFTPALDPTGLVIARARDDVSGASFKAGYLSPRLLGLRLGVSYAPEANLRGADFDPTFDAPSLGRARLEDIWEGAASFARNFSSAGLRVRAAVTATHATSHSRFFEFGDYQAWGAGLELEKGHWSTGLRWLASDNAWRAGHAGYEAWEASLVRQGDTWRIGLEGGWAQDDLTRTEGASWLVGARRKINERVDVGLAWSSAAADLPLADISGFRHTNVRNDGLVLELTVRK